MANPALTPREKALLAALKVAEAWMVAAIEGCEAEGTSVSLPRGYRLDLDRVRAAIAKAEAR